MGLLEFKSKNDEILNHWIAFADGFTISPQEFYSAISKELQARKIPGLEIAEIEYPEGGFLSDKRIYLRLIRERLAFDTCTAPFGTGSFFSFRSVHSPASIRLWQLLLILLILTVMFEAMVRLLGQSFAIVAIVTFVFAVGQVFRNTVAKGLADLDTTLLKSPIIGPLYERCFRKDTYYREDARLVYLDAVSKLVKDVAEEAAAAKGVKLIRQFERAPILGLLYKPVNSEKKDDPVEP